MSEIIIIDLSDSFESRKRSFFDDLDRIAENYSDWFSKRKPLGQEKKPDEHDSIYYHISWIEVHRGHPYILFKILKCDDRPEDLGREMLNAFKNRFNGFNPHTVT